MSADPADAVMELIFGRWRSQILYAGVDHLCDVAGGYGYLLSHLVAEHPGLTGEVLELPKVVDEAGLALAGHHPSGGQPMSVVEARIP